MYNELDILGNQLIKNTRDISRQNSQRRNESNNSNGISIPAIHDSADFYYFEMEDIVYFNKFNIKFMASIDSLYLVLFKDILRDKVINLTPYLLSYFGTLEPDIYQIYPAIDKSIDLLKIASDMKGLGLDYTPITSPGLKCISTRTCTTMSMIIQLRTSNLNR